MFKTGNISLLNYSTYVELIKPKAFLGNRCTLKPKSLWPKLLQQVQIYFLTAATYFTVAQCKSFLHFSCNNNTNNNNIIIIFSFTSFLANRKTIKILFPKEAAVRQHTQELSPDYKSLISKFESLNIKHHRRTSSSEAQFVQHQHVGFSFSKVIFVVLSILGIGMVSSLAVSNNVKMAGSLIWLCDLHLITIEFCK